ncbi:coronin-1A-like [Antedon mediterranea]|uniref:coronin-1A-like n=1 Tax=Antedon mediterranea TaxID=105859 RepID=UPI003AF75622
MAFVRASKFRHIFGKKNPAEQSFTNVTLSNESFDGVMITANPKFLAFVVRTEGGGAFMVLPLEQYGRIDQNAPKVEGHENKVLTLAWNPFNDNIIASGDDYGRIKLFEIPDGGLKEPIREAALQLDGHQRKVQLLMFHRSAENILFSASADNDIKIWNLETSDVIQSCTFPDFLYSMDLKKDGSELVVSCKDKNFRVLDARTLEEKAKWKGHEGSKPSFIQFANFNMFISTGFSRMSERELRVWNQSTKAKLNLMEMDTSNSPLHIYYDSDLNVIFLTGKGDSAIRYYELVEADPYLHFLSTQTDSSGHKRIGNICKRAVNPALKEICRFYRFEKNNITVMSMIVPRKSETFQEDIYPDTASDIPALTADEWIGGKNAEPNKFKFQDSFKNSGKATISVKKFGGGLKKTVRSAAAAGEGGEDEFNALKKEVEKLKSTVTSLESRIKVLENK